MGIYGLIANSVALPGVALALAGVVVGSVLAGFATQMLRHLVWGVRPGDPLTFVAVGLVSLGVAAAASFLPALRVARLNLAETLRQE